MTIQTESHGSSVRAANVGFASAPMRPQRALSRAAGLWFLLACVGQLAFVYFILGFYGSRTLVGDFAGWDDKPLIEGYVAGDLLGNLMFIAHVLLAAVITAGGLWQLVPALRRRWPAVHRWNGRLFILIAYVMALGGLWLTWGRGTHLSLESAWAITLNGLLIIGFATLAWRRAMAREIDAHRRWALRTFMVVNGVWFLRVGMMAWVLINQGPAGMNATMSGPANIAINFGCYLIPLAVLELYFLASRSDDGLVRRVAIGMIGLAVIVTGIGIFGTIALMWGPHL